MLSASEVHIEESSFNERVCAIYTRDVNRNILYMDGKYKVFVEKYWDQISTICKEDGFKTNMGVSERYCTMERVEEFQYGNIMVDFLNNLKTNNLPVEGIKMTEVQANGESQVRGVVSLAVGAKETEFDKWFEALILGEAKLNLAQYPCVNTDKSISNVITNIFDRELRNVTEDDQWEVIGRSYFKDRVEFFTARNLTIEACLPAFPCKSSNTQKVAGTRPDKGEEMALKRLISIAKIVKEVYAPGIKFWIVSDGHVFSDCIGVDDDVVNTYGDQLRDMYLKITDGDHISFCSLPQLFTSSLHAFEDKYTSDVVLPHYLDTKIDRESEICREILMSGCSTDPSILRSLIDNSDPAKLALYRGFAKFMLEDLALHPVALKNSKKFCKKLSSKVAFEMIKVSLLQS